MLTLMYVYSKYTPPVISESGVQIISYEQNNFVPKFDLRVKKLKLRAARSLHLEITVTSDVKRRQEQY